MKYRLLVIPEEFRSSVGFGSSVAQTFLFAGFGDFPVPSQYDRRKGSKQKPKQHRTQTLPRISRCASIADHGQGH